VVGIGPVATATCTLCDGASGVYGMRTAHVRAGWLRRMKHDFTKGAREHAVWKALDNVRCVRCFLGRCVGDTWPRTHVVTGSSRLVALCGDAVFAAPMDEHTSNDGELCVLVAAWIADEVVRVVTTDLANSLRA